jgi:hypothetical protein
LTGPGPGQTSRTGCRVDGVGGEGDDRVQRPLGQFAVPEADRERAAIEVVLDRKDRRESANRQGHPPHRCSGEQAQCAVMAGPSARRQYPAPRTVSMSVSPSLRRR